MTPAIAIDFLKKILPFSELENSVLHKLAGHCLVDFFPKGTKILTAHESEIHYFFLIQQGGVKSSLTNENGEVTLKDYRGEGAGIGALSIIQGTLANLDVETVEDTFCFLLPKEVFLNLLNTQKGFAQYYLKSFSEKIVQTAYTELRRHKVSKRASDDLYLFSVAVGDLVKTQRKASTAVSIQQAAAMMAKYKAGSILLHTPEDQENIIGIITDRDLRTKVVAAGFDFTNPAAAIMSSPVKRVLSRDICFDVLLKMMSQGIHHLAVERAGRIIGVVTSHDIMLLQGQSPYYLFKKIISQQEISDLYPLAKKIPDVIRNLLHEGGKAGHITKMLALLNDHLLSRLLTLLEQELGPPPVPYCWLLIGSEGRKEQTFKTDQDNAILYQDPKTEAQKQEAIFYFKKLAQKTIDHLVNCGYPLCSEETMATNPDWCMPYSSWTQYFETLITVQNPDSLIKEAIFFDFRSGYGNAALADNLRQYIYNRIREQNSFLKHLGEDCINTRNPLSFFNNFIVEKNGEHKNKLDIKNQGLSQFVKFARVMALKFNIYETNTLLRLRALSTEEHVPQEIMNSAYDAYELQMQLRLIHQLNQLEEGAPPDNFIDPASLTDLEKRTLKDAFHIVERLQAILKEMFFPT